MSSLRRPSRAWLVAALPLLASCASLIGLEDAAGELEEDTASSATSTGAGGTTATATATASVGSSGGEAGSGGAATASAATGGGEGGGGGGGGGQDPVDFDVAIVEGVGSITDLQASLGGAVFLAVDGVEEGGALAGCEWPAPGVGLDRSALALRVSGDGTCSVVRRIDVDGDQLSIRSVGASFGGAFLGLGGTFQGMLTAGATEPLAANAPVAFAALADQELPFVGFTNPELLNDGDGVGFVGGRGSMPTFFGHFEGDKTIAAIDAGFGSHCGTTGVEGATTIAAFPVHVDCTPPTPHPAEAGVVLDVVSTNLRLGALYLAGDGPRLQLALMGSDADGQVLLGLFPGVEATARIAIEGDDTLIGGTLGAGVVADSYCGVGLQLDAAAAFGAHVSGPTSCDALWTDTRYRRAVPVGALASASVYLVESVSEAPEERGWWLAATDDHAILEVRRFCTDCSVVDATLAGTFAYVAGRTSVGDTVGGVTADLDGAFVARIARADLLTGLTPPPVSR